MHQRPPDSKAFVVVGAGLAGVSVATQFISAGVDDLAVLDRRERVGGVWTAFGNAFSRVNSALPGYHLRLKYRPTANTNHSYAHEVLTDCAQAFKQFSLAQRTHLGVDVVAVVAVVNHVNNSPSWRLECCWGGARRAFSVSTWAILCTSRRLGAPRDLFVRGEDAFGGQIRRAVSNEAWDVDWKSRQVLILGHGPYATENARTALEHGAAHVTFAVRRHGIVCPEMVEYLNYVRDYDEAFDRPAGGSAAIVNVWREAYRESTATPPEVWSEGRFLPDGHTVSVSGIVPGTRTTCFSARAPKHQRSAFACRVQQTSTLLRTLHGFWILLSALPSCSTLVASRSAKEIGLRPVWSSRRWGLS